MEQENSVQTKQSKPGKRTVTISSRAIIGVFVLIIVAAGGFIGGMQYQKGHGGSKTSASSQSAQAGAGGQFGGGQGRRSMDGGFGSVTAVSATSITVSDTRSNSTKTYTIDSSTKITDNDQTVDYTDIAVGDTVIITTSSTTSTTATAIRVNPSMGGFGGGQQQSSTGSSDTTDNSAVN